MYTGAPRVYPLNKLVRVHTGVYRDTHGKCSFKSLSLGGWVINTLLIRKRSLRPRTHVLKGHWKSHFQCHRKKEFITFSTKSFTARILLLLRGVEAALIWMWNVWEVFPASDPQLFCSPGPLLEAEFLSGLPGDTSRCPGFLPPPQSIFPPLSPSFPTADTTQTRERIRKPGLESLLYHLLSIS